MDKRFLQPEGTQVFSGTELLLKGGLEAGVGLMTGYPGSPVAAFFDNLASVKELLVEKGIVGTMANNEALAAAMVNGSQMEDIRAMTVMKSVGLHVAMDSLALGNLSKYGRKGGGLIVVGDDPWSDSTQVPADSRYAFKHLYMPVLEPSTIQEVKDFVAAGLDLSGHSDLYVGYIITTNLADGGGTVTCRPNRYPAVNVRDRITVRTGELALEKTVVLSPRTADRESDLLPRFQVLLDEARRMKLNRIEHKEVKSQIGFVASGLALSYLEHALAELGLTGKFPILKLALSYPVDRTLVEELATSVKKIIVVEEKRDFLESQVSMIIKDLFQEEAPTLRTSLWGRGKDIPTVWGKRLPDRLPGFPQTEGLNPSLVMERLIPFLKREHKSANGVNRTRLQQEAAVIDGVQGIQTRLPDRTPTFCPGCPHRDSSSVLKEIKKDFMDTAYMQRNHRRAPVDLVFHGDTGCYTMLMFEPNQDLMHNYSGMGLGGATGAGIDPFIDNKQVVFMGDGTFFHSGQVSISNSIKQNQDITYIILENKTTAMTGHQPTSATSTDVLGRPTTVQDIERILDGMITDESAVVRINPEERKAYKSMLEKTLLRDGVKIVIADKECGITYQRRKKSDSRRTVRERGFLPVETRIQTTHEVCEFCLECTRATGCPALTFEGTEYGTKVQTDYSFCESDGACHRIKACPSFEEVRITRRQAPRDPLESMCLDDIPEPARAPMKDAWRSFVAGVGGMGIGVVTAVLVRAGYKQGYRVVFSDRKGMAIRNGGVYSHISYISNGRDHSPIIPYGKADLLIGVDLLESARALSPANHVCIASPGRTAAVINTGKTATISVLTGKDDQGILELEDALYRQTDPCKTFGFDVFALAEKYFSNKLYSNMILLGMACQRGLLPLSYDSLNWAIEKSVPRSGLKQNKQAFLLGRKLISHPHVFGARQDPLTWEELIENKSRYLPGGSQGKRAQDYRKCVRKACEAMSVDETTLRDFALRVYDLIQYQNLAYAQRYISILRSVYDKDSKDFDWQATRAVVHYLAKVMLIKDEVYVSYLLTRPEKMERDRARFGVDPAHGDRLTYKHFNRPQFTVLGLDIEFDIDTYNWQLAMMRHMKFLRTLLPAWHRREKEFRTWYQGLASRFAWSDERSYRTWCEILKLPEEVRGYRKIRYPHMEYAIERARVLLKSVSASICEDSSRDAARLRPTA